MAAAKKREAKTFMMVDMMVMMLLFSKEICEILNHTYII
jgi:hypothetical protein